MGLETFKLKSLVGLDGGRINAAFERMLRRAYADCADRPGLKTARKIQLTLSVVPVCASDGSGDLATCDVSFKFGESLPPLESRPYNMVASNGQLVFNELSPEDVRQTTIDDVGPRGSTHETEDARTEGEAANAG